MIVAAKRESQKNVYANSHNVNIEKFQETTAQKSDFPSYIRYI